MKMNARSGLAMLSGIVLVVTAWAGASIYVGRIAAAELRDFASRSSSASSMSITAARHDAGLFSSTGTFEVRFDEHCNAPGGTARASMKVEYRVSHLLLPGSMMRFDWTAVPSGEVGAALAEATDNALRMGGQGTVSYMRAVTSSLAMPELSIGSGPQALRVSAGSGHLKLAGNGLALQWKTERIAGRSAGKALEVVNVGFDIDLKDRALGTGTMTLAIDRIGTGFGSAEGFRLVTAAEARGDRIDVTVTPSLRMLEAPGQKASDLSLQISLRDIHAASLQAIQRIGSETCGFKVLKPEQEQKLSAAVRTALTGGLSLGIDRVKGTIGDGSLEGILKVELKKAGDAIAATSGEPLAIDLAKLLAASGELVVKGSVVNAGQRQMALSMGFATEVPGGLRAAFEYSDGLLKANGRVFDAGALQVALATADRRLNTFLGVSMPAQVIPKGGQATSLEAALAADAAPAPASPDPLVNSAPVRPAPNTSLPLTPTGPANSAPVR